MTPIVQIHINEWSPRVYILFAMDAYGHDIGKFGLDSFITKSLVKNEEHDGIRRFNSKRNAIRWLKTMYVLSNKHRCSLFCTGYYVTRKLNEDK